MVATTTKSQRTRRSQRVGSVRGGETPSLPGDPMLVGAPVACFLAREGHIFCCQSRRRLEGGSSSRSGSPSAAPVPEGPFRQPQPCTCCCAGSGVCRRSMGALTAGPAPAPNLHQGMERARLGPTATVRAGHQCSHNLLSELELHSPTVRPPEATKDRVRRVHDNGRANEIHMWAILMSKSGLRERREHDRAS